MRRMSFAMTKDAVRARRKWVTRRQGWKGLKAGDRFVGIERGQGLKKGEHQVVIAPQLVCTANLTVRIGDMTGADCFLEGFPEMTAEQFVAMYCKANRVTPDDECQRISFLYVADNCRCHYIAPEVLQQGVICSPCTAINHVRTP